MPKRADEELKTEAGTYLSKIETNKVYDKETVASIRVRVPKDWKPIIQEYVENSDKYSSVNEMFVEFIKNEIGADNLPVKEHKKKGRKKKIENNE